MTNPHEIYVNINKQTVALFLIAEVLQVSKYKLFLLYETFGNDVFLFFSMMKTTDAFKELTEVRLRRAFLHAERLTPMLLGHPKTELCMQEQRSYQKLLPHLYENKLKLTEEY